MVGMEIFAAALGLTAAEDRLTWASPGLGSGAMDHTSLYRLAESSTVAILLRTMASVGAQHRLVALACSFFAIVSAVVASCHLKTIRQLLALLGERQAAAAARLAACLPGVSSALPGLRRRLAEQVVGLDELRELRAKTADRDDAALARDGWELMMDRATESMRYRAWRRDLRDGLTEYRSSTVARGVRPCEMNELYLDDGNRLGWDFCFRDYEALPCGGLPGGGDVVRWVRKFPVCSLRDYVLARRSFTVDGEGGAVYTITRSTEHPAAPRREKPHRVDRFYSSWLCREARWPGGGRATETVLVHCEDIGVPRDIAKFVVRQGMWRMVLKIEEAVRAYVAERRARGDAPRPGLTGVCARPTRVAQRELARPGAPGAQAGGRAFMRSMSREEADGVARRRRIRGCVLLALAVAAVAARTGAAVPSAGLLAVGTVRLARRR